MVMNGKIIAILLLLLFCATAAASGEPMMDPGYPDQTDRMGLNQNPHDNIPSDPTSDYIVTPPDSEVVTNTLDDHIQNRIGSYTIEYVGANSAVITWSYGWSATEFRVFRNGASIVTIYADEPYKFINVGLDRGTEYQYRIEFWDMDRPVDQRYIGYYDGDTIIPGEVYGDLSQFGETDTWRGGTASLRFGTGNGNLQLSGSTLILKDIILTGEWDDHNQRYTKIEGFASQIGGAIQATGTTFNTIELRAWNTGTADLSFLDNCHATNTNFYLSGPNIR